MKWSRIALLVLVLIAAMLAAGPAAAGKKSAPLPVTGRTIAGPGSITVGSLTEVWKISGTATRDVCVTLSNEGRFPAGLTMDVATISVSPGTTATLCGAGQSDLHVFCLAVSTCLTQIQWRVDLM